MSNGQATIQFAITKCIDLHPLNSRNYFYSLQMKQGENNYIEEFIARNQEKKQCQGVVKAKYFVCS